MVSREWLTNIFEAYPRSPEDEHLLRDLLDALAALWNEVNYERLIRYDDEARYESAGVWDVATGHLDGNYKDALDTDQRTLCGAGSLPEVADENEPSEFGDIADIRTERIFIHRRQ